MEYSSVEEIVFKYIVKGLIELETNRDEIIEILLRNKLLNFKKVERYDKLLKKYLGYTRSSQGEYIHQEDLLEGDESYWTVKKSTVGKSEEQNGKYISLNKIIHDIASFQDGSIPPIEELKLACTLSDDDYQSIEISQNDTATLLKNIACIESKLNQIARAVNTIAKALDIAKNNMDK